MKKVLMCATVASMIGQFNMNNLDILMKLGYETHVACDFNDESVWTNERIEKFKEDMCTLNITCHQIDFSRNPLNIRKDLASYMQMKSLVRKERFNLIHCHTPVAAAISRVVAHQERIKIIYTAHGFHFYKGAPIKNWLVFYPIEKFLSRWTDTLITINKEDYQRAKNHFYAKRIVYVPGVGIDTKKFHSRLNDTKFKRTELGLTDKDIMLLSVGELSSRKNHQVVINALGSLKKQERLDNIHYFICGKGDLLSDLQVLAHKLKIDNVVKFLGFRSDIAELCQAADLFIFSSLQEGLPVALMEAIACNTPVICSKIRGNEDLIHNDSDMFDVKDMNSLVSILKEKLFDKNGMPNRSILVEKMQTSVKENYMNILQIFVLTNVEQQMTQIYREIK